MSRAHNEDVTDHKLSQNIQSQNANSEALLIFCREVRNLLRSKQNCMIPFSKFVPAYHNHYGRQCCVYQFGYTKLIELLESIPHVVQIIGDGANRYITLTHREQIKRFASDLIKVVKAQSGKRLKLSQFARAYEHVLDRQFRIEDYGTDNINVLLAEIWEGTINIMPIRRELADPCVKGPLYVKTGSSTASNARSRSQLNRRRLVEQTRYACNHESSSCDECILSPSLDPILSSTLMSSPMRTPSSMCSLSTSGSSLNDGMACGSVSIQRSSCKIEQLIQQKLFAMNEPVSKPYITEEYPDAWFEVPKRERSDKEIKRTKYFVRDVIELLSKMKPHYSVAFSRFIPSYHYYFNRQCKVSIFGFSKLIDLFESISPEVVEIIDQEPGEDKIIKLSSKFINNRRPLQTRNYFIKTRYEEYEDNNINNSESEAEDYILPPEPESDSYKRSSRMAAAIENK